MDKLLLAVLSSGIILTSLLAIPNAESYLAIPPNRAFSLIFGPGGTNLTAPFGQSNYTITGGDITFFPDNFTINFGPNHTALFLQLNDTVFSLNGSIPVLIEGDQITLTQIGNLTEISLEDCLDDQFLLYSTTSSEWLCTDISTINGTGPGNGNGTIITNQTLQDAFFNAEEATVDDLSGTPCVSDVTLSFFGNTDPNQYRRQAIEFCADAETDDNFSWLYVVPQHYNASKDFKFRLFWTDDNGDGGTFTKRVIASSDDAEESIGPIDPGRVSTGSSDLELHAENIVESPPDRHDLIGMRWTNVTVPNSATITNATIQFHVDEENPDEPITVRFKGHDIDDAPTFVSGTNFNVSSRANTTAFVDWAIPHWENVHDEGPDQLTPDLSSIIQEIVDRPGWVSGNALVIKTTEWIDCNHTTCTKDGLRHAEAFDGEEPSAPELSISFTTAAGGETPVCFEISLLPLELDDDLEGTFIARQTVCVNRAGQDQLSITEWTVSSSSHNFESGDLVMLRFHRADDFVADDFESNVFVLGGELKYVN